MNETLDRLLQAHVRHELEQLQGEQLDRSVSRAVASLFVWSQTVTLQEVVTPAQINGVIDRYVVELRVSGGITELTGELSRLVLKSSRSATTRVDEILTPASYAEFADKLMSLERVRRGWIEKLARSVAFSTINASLMARSVLDTLTPTLLLQSGPLGARLSVVWETLSPSLRPELERRLAELLGRYLEQHRAGVTQNVEKRLLQVLNPDNIRSLLDEIWDDVAPMRLSEAFALLGEQDLEDFVVLVHEFWLRYRKSEFFHAISREMVAHFFAKYGEETLASLVDDMGVSQSMVSEELSIFLRPMLKHALESGALEQAVRSRLSGFYHSDAALSALEGRPRPHSR